MPEAFEVVPYNVAALEGLFASKSRASPEVIHQKLHSLYFENYFQALGAKTILVENNYIDRDFIEDFAGYYVRCFPEYERKCARLHFFSRDLATKEFESFFSGAKSSDFFEELQAHYLGFIVVKPLPQTVIGRTCLKTYAENGSRVYPITRRYEANLFGIPLEVKTLAFQEQDKVAAACATSALWSVFHGTGVLFHHPILSPVEITKAANAILPMESRSLPSQGLTAMQMAHAIRSIGLEPFLIGARSEYLFKSALYGYLRGRVPVLVGVDLYNTTDPSNVFPMGKHAIAATGFSLGSGLPHPFQDGFLLRASQIDKVYTHDDQVGPFARMVFDNVRVPLSPHASLGSVTTSWGVRENQTVRACPELMLVPLYHKIRIPFESILGLVMRFDSLLETLRTEFGMEVAERPVWDIYLTTVNEFKQNVTESAVLESELRRELLIAAMPKFLWTATAFVRGQPVLELLFDATDIEQGEFFVRAVEYDSAISRFLREFAKIPKVQSLYRAKPEYRILRWFEAGAL